MSVGIELPKQIERAAKIKSWYVHTAKEMGDSGRGLLLTAACIQVMIDQAHAAIASGDPVDAILAYKDLSELDDVPAEPAGET
tara:strand:+ start:171 stop:419 length:249 start_codon:yes stop_codon:yes gene_type:complete